MASAGDFTVSSEMRTTRLSNGRGPPDPREFVPTLEWNDGCQQDVLLPGSGRVRFQAGLPPARIACVRPPATDLQDPVSGRHPCSGLQLEPGPQPAAGGSQEEGGLPLL